MSLSRTYGTAKLVTASSLLQRQFRVFLALMLGVVLFQTAPAKFAKASEGLAERQAALAAAVIMAVGVNADGRR